MKPISDSARQLFDLIAKDDEVAFTAFYSQIFETVYRRALGLTGQSHDAEELTQETFASLWAYRHLLSKVDHPRAYLFRILYHHFSRYQRVQNILKTHFTLEEECFLIPDHADTSSDLHQRLFWNHIQQCISLLKPRQKQAFTLIRLEGKTRAAAARLMRISISATNQRLALAEDSIRQLSGFVLTDLPR